MTTSRSVLLIMRNFSNKYVKKIKANHLCSTNFFLNFVPFVSNVGKYDRAIQAANDNMVQGHGMLDK
jgi:hypothetical protein